MLDKIIKNELGINLLPLEVTDLSGTLLAALECYPDGGDAKIWVRGVYSTEFDKVFAVCHEMRHYWQLKNNFCKVENYDKIDKNIYNSREAEMDANAFAAFVLIKYYKVKPLFNGLSEKVKQQILDYAFETFDF